MYLDLFPRPARKRGRLERINVDGLPVYVAGKTPPHWQKFGAPSVGEPERIGLFFPGGPGSRVPEGLAVRTLNPLRHCTITLPYIGCEPRPWEPIAPHAVTTYMHQVKELLATLQVPKVSVMGGSYGGLMGLLFASLYPNMVERVVVYSASSPEAIDHNFHPYAAPAKYPDEWQLFLAAAESMRETNVVKAYSSSFLAQWNKLQAGTALANSDVALVNAWNRWQGVLSGRVPESLQAENHEEVSGELKRLVVMAGHCAGRFFVDGERLQKSLEQVSGAFPVTIVMGEVDNCTPVHTITPYVQAVKGTLQVMPGEGHSFMASPAMRHHFITALNG